MCVPLNLPVRWMVFAVAKVMSVVTRQTLWRCCSSYAEAYGMLWITAERKLVDPLSYFRSVTLVRGVGGLRVLYYHCSASRCCTVMFSALPVVSSGEAWGHGDVHNCVPVKLNNSIMLVFCQ